MAASYRKIVLVWHPAGRSSEEDRGQAVGAVQGPHNWLAMDVPISLEARPAIECPSWHGDATPLVIHDCDSYFRVDVQVATWQEARTVATPAILALVAFSRKMTYLRARVAVNLGCGRAGALILGTEHVVSLEGLQSALAGPHVLVDTSRPQARAHVFDACFLGGRDSEPMSSINLDSLLVPAYEDAAGYLAPKAARSYLRSQLGFQERLTIQCLPGCGARCLLPAMDQTTDRGIQELAVALRAWTIPSTALLDLVQNPLAFDSADTYPPVLAAYSRSQIDRLREMQLMAGQVYGRLEPERALNWTVEELGELAQAIRREERSVRLSEELGQLFSWILCLSNICQIDLAAAADEALRHEAMRQYSKYGALRPYLSSTSLRSSS